MDIRDFSTEELEVLKAVASQSVGFTTESGLDAIQLDAYAKLAYAIRYPLLKKFAHIQPEMAGQRWGGQSYQWKNLTNPNYSGLVAPVSPGNRNAISTIATSFQSAPYATLGYDQAVQDEEYEQERGFDDPVKNARLTTMHNILRMYDIGVACFNRGPDTNGFALGTANTPSLSVSSSGGTLADGTTVYVTVVELTAFGVSQQNINAQGVSLETGLVSASTVLTPFFIRTPANASQSESVPNGVGLPSATANMTTPSSTSTGSVTVTATPKAGAFGWAVFAGTSSATSAQKLYAISQTPVVNITSLPLSGAQTLAAFNTLQASTDTSYNGSSGGTSNSPAPEFDGEFAYIAGSNPANFIQMGGASFTSSGLGTVVEIDTAIRDQYLATLTVPDEVICGVNAIDAITAAVQSGDNFGYGYRKGVDSDGGLQAGAIIKEYRLKYSQDGNQAIIPVSVSPNIPANCVWLPNYGNPFVSTSNTIPNNLELAEIKPMYSKDFAQTGRSWQLGTYVQTTLVKRAPFLGFVFSGASPIFS